MKRIICLAVISVAVPALTFAQGHHQPPASTESSQVRSLTASEVQGYLLGRGMGMAKPAELNGYPGPMHVLELADKLDLTVTQRRDTQKTFDSMRAEATRLGKAIVDRETELNRLFADGKANRAMVERKVNEIARLQASLRAVHLYAHLEMKHILSPVQVKIYDELRGHSSPAAAQ